MGISRVYLWDILRICWGYLYDIFGTSGKYLGNILGISWEYLLKSLVYLGHIVAINWGYIGDIQRMSAGYHHGITWKSRSLGYLGDIWGCLWNIYGIF